jgi:hypothetical protein
VKYQGGYTKVFKVTGWVQFGQDPAYEMKRYQIAKTSEEAIEMVTKHLGKLYTCKLKTTLIAS